MVQKKINSVKKAKSPKVAKSKSANNAFSKKELPKKDLLKCYELMYKMRRFEESASQAYTMGLIGGFCHLYIGQEAVGVGIKQASSEEDLHITTYRDHAHMISCGMDPEGIMGELMGRSNGYSKGKGGSMHMFSPDKKFYGGHGIVGANVPLGTGLAMAQKYKKEKGVTWCYFGDGAAHQGQVYEAMNIAALWDVPVIYVIENNGYAMGTSVARATSQPDLYRRGEGWNVKGMQVDGMDFESCYHASVEARKHAIDNQQPIIMEFMTYRYKGHSMSDPAKYRLKQEVDKMRQDNDCIEGLQKKLIQIGVKKAELDKIHNKVDKEIDAAVEVCKNAPYPDDSELTTDVLIEE